MSATEPSRAPSGADPAVRPNCLLTDAMGVGLLTDSSDRTIRRLNSAGKMPRPIKIGGAVKWRIADIQEWVAMGCPDRKSWEATRKS